MTCSTADRNGCPVCGWDGPVAEHQTRTARNYTHAFIVEGELLTGKTCRQLKERKRGLVGKTYDSIKETL